MASSAEARMESGTPRLCGCLGWKKDLLIYKVSSWLSPVDADYTTDCLKVIRMCGFLTNVNLLDKMVDAQLGVVLS